MRRHLLRAALAVVLLLAGYPIVVIGKYALFPPRYDVTSIATTREYQDPALLERAWSLPVAASYQHRVDFQKNGSVCGPTSAANTFRSLGDGPTTVDDVLAGTGTCPFGFCWNGISLDELATLIRGKTRHRVTVLRGLTLDEFRAHMAQSNDPTRRYIVNFHRGLLFSKGGGHHSPIAGYLQDRDLVFVLDVSSTFGPWLVSTERLFEAVDSADSGAGKKRGLILLQ
jgi:hypothetical protein